MELQNAMAVSVSGLRAQGTRIRVISENIANANSDANVPGEDPYTRKVVTFGDQVDREMGTTLVEVKNVLTPVPQNGFPLRFDPDHPGADVNGYVRTPNVKSLIEMNDMREAQRSYEANINMVEMARSMMARTVDLLR